MKKKKKRTNNNLKKKRNTCNEIKINQNKRRYQKATKTTCVLVCHTHTLGFVFPFSKETGSVFLFSLLYGARPKAKKRSSIHFNTQIRFKLYNILLLQIGIISSPSLLSFSYYLFLLGMYKILIDIYEMIKFRRLCIMHDDSFWFFVKFCRKRKIIYSSFLGIFQ